MSSKNRKQTLSTVSEDRLNNRAPQRAYLLAGLELFVNTGDSDEEYRRVHMLVPTFWPLCLRGPFGPSGLDQPLEWPEGGQPLFRAFRDYLRRLWRSDFYKDDGSTVDSRYLEYVLGLETRYAVDPPGGLIDAELPEQSFRDAWQVLRQQHIGVYCIPTVALGLSWRNARLELLSPRDFQNAVYELLKQSWRAKLCRRCGKYFIADKPAQMSCSTTCSNKSKLESGRRYWHEKGSSLREQRSENGRSNGPRVSGSKTSGRRRKKGERR